MLEVVKNLYIEINFKLQNFKLNKLLFYNINHYNKAKIIVKIYYILYLIYLQLNLQYLFIVKNLL